MRPEQSYAIWLVPRGETNNRISKIINELSDTYKSPKFVPHVCLVGGFFGDENNLINNTKILSMKLNTFNVRLTDVSCLDEFFRSVFILVEKTPEFMHAYEAARSVFNCYGGLYNPENYMPHLSLIYANLGMNEKECIMDKIGRSFNISFKADNLHLFHSNERDKEWTKICEFPLR